MPNMPWAALNSVIPPNTQPSTMSRGSDLNVGQYLPGPTPPGVVNFMPGFQMKSAAFGQGLGAAQAQAGADRSSAKMAYGLGLDSIAQDVGNRGVEFSGIHKQLNQQATNAYEQVLAKVAANLAGARATNSQQMADLNAQNLAFRASEQPPLYQGGPNVPTGYGVLEALRQQAGGNYVNPQGGAYGMDQKMWEQYGGTGPISKAPQQVQDRVALAAVNSILAQHQNNLEWVPAMFRYGAQAQQPWAGTGIQNYVNSWLNSYRTLYGGGVGGGPSNRRYG